LRDSRHCSWRRRRMRAQRASFLPRATAECAKSSALRRLPTTLESYPAIIKSVTGRRTLPQPVLDLPVRKGRDRRSSLPYGVNRNCSSSENSAGTTWFRSMLRCASRAPPLLAHDYGINRTFQKPALCPRPTPPQMGGAWRYPDEWPRMAETWRFFTLRASSRRLTRRAFCDMTHVLSSRIAPREPIFADSIAYNTHRDEKKSEKNCRSMSQRDAHSPMAFFNRASLLVQRRVRRR
jgi:hypothetical protein